MLRVTRLVRYAGKQPEDVFIGHPGRLKLRELVLKNVVTSLLSPQFVKAAIHVLENLGQFLAKRFDIVSNQALRCRQIALFQGRVNPGQNGGSDESIVAG